MQTKLENLDYQIENEEDLDDCIQELTTKSDNYETQIAKAEEGSRTKIIVDNLGLRPII